MDSDVAFGLPFDVILVESIEITSCIVEEDTRWSQIAEHFRRFVLGDRLQQASLLLPVYNV